MTWSTLNVWGEGRGAMSRAEGRNGRRLIFLKKTGRENELVRFNLDEKNPHKKMRME